MRPAERNSGQRCKKWITAIKHPPNSATPPKRWDKRQTARETWKSLPIQRRGLPRVGRRRPHVRHLPRRHGAILRAAKSQGGIRIQTQRPRNPSRMQSGTPTVERGEATSRNAPGDGHIYQEATRAAPRKQKSATYQRTRPQT